MTTPSLSEQRVLAAALPRSDYLRRSPWSVGGLGGHKEWLHFCVHAPDLDVLVNFSLSDDVRPEAIRGVEVARLVILVRERERGWMGDVDTFEPRDTIAHGGKIHLAFGGNEVWFDGETYQLTAALRDQPIRVDIALQPLTMPSLANNVALDPGPPINWLLVPRLRATGVVISGARSYTFENAPAYHDHNWGHFAWGRDFAWEWGFGLPASLEVPWSMVFVRLSDRAHTNVYLQALLLWRGFRQFKVFRMQSVEVEHSGHMRCPRLFKLPRPMALVSPDQLPDVPERVRIVASDGSDRVECVFDAVDVAQVIVPNDHDFGVTIINEVSGVVQVRGVALGEQVEMSGRAIFEFLGA